MRMYDALSAPPSDVARERAMSCKLLNWSALLAVVLLATPAAGVPAFAAEREDTGSADVAGKPESAPEEERVLEREEAEKLRRLREEQELRRREAARKLDAEQARQLEIVRLQTNVMNLEQRESTLQHDVRTLQQQLGALPRDPADHSAAARRSDLEHQLGHSQNQLDYATRSREEAVKKLHALRFRY